MTSRLQVAFGAIVVAVTAMALLAAVATPLVSARGASATPDFVSEIPVSPPESSMVAFWSRFAPFRRSRRPAPVRYTSAPAASATVIESPPSLPRPVLQLRGLTWGPHASAVIEGLPGREGPQLVHAGDTLGALRIRGISAKAVTIAGLDTLWRLELPGATD